MLCYQGYNFLFYFTVTNELQNFTNIASQVFSKLNGNGTSIDISIPEPVDKNKPRTRPVFQNSNL